MKSLILAFLGTTVLPSAAFADADHIADAGHGQRSVARVEREGAVALGAVSFTRRVGKAVERTTAEREDRTGEQTDQTEREDAQRSHARRGGAASRPVESVYYPATPQRADSGDRHRDLVVRAGAGGR